VSKPIYEVTKKKNIIDFGLVATPAPTTKTETKTILDGFVEELETELEKVEQSDLEMNLENPIDKKFGEIEFWNFIESLNWTNRSERYINPHAVKLRIISTLSEEETHFFKEMLSKKMLEISDKIESCGVFTDKMFSGEQKTRKIQGLLSHIVALGSTNYGMISEDPMFAYTYIVDGDEQFQSLYDCLPD
jgi:hypothetical protein